MAIVKRGQHFEITFLHMSERQGQGGMDQIREFTENLPCGVLIFAYMEKEGLKTLFYNDYFWNKLRYKEDQFRKQMERDPFFMVPEEERDKIMARLKEIQGTGGHIAVNLTFYRKDGNRFQYRMLGAPAYRAGQIFKWAQKAGVSSYDEMTDVPKALRAQLAERFSVAAPQMLRRQIAQDGTRKYLWGFADGNCVESVLMQYVHGYTICISTQAGCRMGCVFCASTIGSKIRDLTPGEIIEQVVFTAHDAQVKISNIVLMGTGEPLDNYDNVVKFLRLVNDRDLFGHKQAAFGADTVRDGLRGRDMYRFISCTRIKHDQFLPGSSMGLS